MSEHGQPMTPAEEQEAEAAITRMDKLLGDTVDDVMAEFADRKAKRLGRGLIDTVKKAE
jgi:tetrahydromethanopterin S-methyltransferase subunit G